MKKKINQTKVCVMGLGYVGLPTASFLASKGFNVAGVDVNESIVKTLNSGDVHIHEPELLEKLREGRAAGRFTASTAPSAADVFIITVPTPVNDAREPMLDYVESAVRMITPFLAAGSLVILESTSPVGTTEAMANLIREERSDLNVPKFTTTPGNAGADSVMVSYCPERILPGRMFREFVDNDRVIGGINPESADAAREFYATIVRGKLFTSDCRTAEMSKLAENTFRDVNVALANELSLICDKLGIDVWKLIELANRHPRVNFLNPGPGVGGHCIPVDPWFIHHAAPELARLIGAARGVNDSMPAAVADRIIAKCAGMDSPKIAVLGLAYKPDIDDLRESPAIDVVRILAEKKAGRLLLVEPFIDAMPEKLSNLDNAIFVADAAEALEQADVVVLLVAHWQFQGIAPEILNAKRDRIVDCTGIWREV